MLLVAQNWLSNLNSTLVKFKRDRSSNICMTFDTLSRLRDEVIMQLFAESINTRLPWHPTEKKWSNYKKGRGWWWFQTSSTCCQDSYWELQAFLIRIGTSNPKLCTSTPLKQLFQNPKWVMIVRTF